jgi:predicted O-methyltransferase YrrM
MQEEFYFKETVEEIKAMGYWPPPDRCSAVGLIEILPRKEIVGCEIGVAHGFNSVYFLDALPNLKKLYAIDPFILYDQDGSRQGAPGIFLSQNNADNIKNMFKRNISPYGDRVEFIEAKSEDTVDQILDSSLDYIFIDGEHSYESVAKDIKNYYVKVKHGGIISGHDFSWPGVQKAVFEFIADTGIDLKFCDNDVWYWIKD